MVSVKSRAHVYAVTVYYLKTPLLNSLLTTNLKKTSMSRIVSELKQRNSPTD